MAKYTASLSAQNTSVYLCDIVQPRHGEAWFANACSTGTFGAGTVTWNLSFDNGTTLIPMTQDGTATAATQTAAGALNLRAGHYKKDVTTTAVARLYASVATATTPAIALTVFTNN